MTDPSLALSCGAVSDVGRHRKKNDDSGYAGPHFLLIADGMGGAPAGNLASSLAIEAMKVLDAPPPDDVLGALRHGIGLANDALAQAVQEDPGVDGMGTTICGALFTGDQIGVVHLGDSRGYLWRDGELLRLTNDHSWVQSLIDEGRITEEEAKTHAYRSMLLKVLDGRHDLEPDLTLYDVQEGDRLLFCSDGLSGFVSHERMQRVLGVGTSQAAAQELTTLALESGSTDNVTVIVGDVVTAAGLDAPPAPVTIGAATEDAMQSPIKRLVPWPGRDQQPHEILVDEADFDPEELRYAPREPRRFVWLMRAAVTIVVLALIAAGLTFAYRWTQQQYYVANVGEDVVIYQGISQDLPGISLSHVHHRTDLQLSELPEYARSRVSEGLPADDLADAETRLARLRGLADACAQAALAEWRRDQTPTTRPTTSRPGTRPTPGQSGSPSGPTSPTGTGGSPTPGSASTPTTMPTLPTDVTPSAADYSELPQCGGATPELDGLTTTSQPSTSPGPGEPKPGESGPTDEGPTGTSTTGSPGSRPTTSDQTSGPNRPTDSPTPR